MTGYDVSLIESLILLTYKEGSVQFPCLKYPIIVVLTL